MIDDEFLSRREIALVYEGVDFYNRRALAGGDPEVARIVTYKMAKVLAMRMRYPPDAAGAAGLARRVAAWLAVHPVSLGREDRVSLVSFYVERLVCNLGGDVRSLAYGDPGFAEEFRDWDAVRSFVATACGNGGPGNAG